MLAAVDARASSTGAAKSVHTEWHYVGRKARDVLSADRQSRPMLDNYLLGFFHWRDHAGDLDDFHPPASLRNLLWGCERWLELHPDALDSVNGRRLEMIKRELEEYLERHVKSPPGTPLLPTALRSREEEGAQIALQYWGER